MLLSFLFVCVRVCVRERLVENVAVATPLCITSSIFSITQWSMPLLGLFRDAHAFTIISSTMLSELELNFASLVLLVRCCVTFRSPVAVYEVPRLLSASPIGRPQLWLLPIKRLTKPTKQKSVISQTKSTYLLFLEDAKVLWEANLF